MPTRNTKKSSRAKPEPRNDNHRSGTQKFHMEYRSTEQEIAWGQYQQNDLVFFLGPAGVGKTFLAAAFAASDILARKMKKILIARPIVEAGGEDLGYLPGEFEKKIDPFMQPVLRNLDKIVGEKGISEQRDKLEKCIETCPIGYMRGMTFDNTVMILDEAQNANSTQLDLFATRMGENSKMIITGDPAQSDINKADLMEFFQDLEGLPGVGHVYFKADSILRHRLVRAICERRHLTPR